MSFSIQMDVRMETERLVLRRFVPDDWKELYEYLSQASVRQYRPYPVYNEEAAKTEATYRSRDFYWAVCLKGNEKLIGDVYFRSWNIGVWEIGYSINEKYQKNGFATEAVEALIDDAFKNKGAHRVEARCDPQNMASWRLLERLGFRQEGRLLQNTCLENDEDNRLIWTDTFIYGILTTEWRKETKADYTITTIKVR